jgi:hypothetical protein
MSTRHLVWRAACLVALVALLPGGCVVTVDPIDETDGDGDGNGGTPATQITIRIVNTTNVTLDPEIYISAEPVSVDQLFRSANKYKAFGVGTQGILADFDSDSFSLDCSAARVIGTRGGKFGDNLNQPDGDGDQIVLQQELNVFCGGTVTFTYSREAGGFSTSYNVTR